MKTLTAEDNQLYYKSMSYRQWLAGLAMQTLLGGDVKDVSYESTLKGLTPEEWIARTSFKMADAMIKESNLT